MTDEGTSLEIERRSKALFGSALRLPVAAFIATHDTGVVTPISVHEELGLPTERYTAVRAELEHLADAGMLARMPRPHGQRTQKYQRLPSVYLEMAAEVFKEIRAQARRRSARRSR